MIVVIFVPIVTFFTFPVCPRIVRHMNEVSNASRGMDMTESFEEMKARYLKQMQEMHKTVPEQTAVSESRPVQVSAQPPIQHEQQPSAALEVTATDRQPPKAAAEEPSSAVMSDEQSRQTVQTGPTPDREPGDTGQGYMIIWAATADEALPVPNAEVVITRVIDGKRTLQAVGTTDQSGRTQPFALPAPSASMSQSPNNPTPFARYDVSVRADGFAHAMYTNIPVFDGIQSVQRADLVPASSSSDVVIDEQNNALSELSPQDTFGKEGDVG